METNIADFDGIDDHGPALAAAWKQVSSAANACIVGDASEYGQAVAVITAKYKEAAPAKLAEYRSRQARLASAVRSNLATFENEVKQMAKDAAKVTTVMERAYKWRGEAEHADGIVSQVESLYARRDRWDGMAGEKYFSQLPGHKAALEEMRGALVTQGENLSYVSVYTSSAMGELLDFLRDCAQRLQADSRLACTGMTFLLRTSQASSDLQTFTGEYNAKFPHNNYQYNMVQETARQTTATSANTCAEGIPAIASGTPVVAGTTSQGGQDIKPRAVAVPDEPVVIGQCVAGTDAGNL